MKPVFKIHIKNNNILVVEGLEDYFPSNETPIEAHDYKWEETTTINVIYKLSSDYKKCLVDYQVIQHGSNYDISEFELCEDGLYGIDRIILPNRQWVENYKISPTETYTSVYFEEDGKFYNLNNSIETEVTLDELVHVDDLTSTILEATKTTFLMYNIFKCYNEKLTMKLNHRLKNCTCNDCEDFKSSTDDILWLFIAAIKFSLQQRDTYKAQWYLEQLNSCNILCDNVNNRKEEDCGCS